MESMEAGMPRKEFLKRGAMIAAAATTAPLAFAETAAAIGIDPKRGPTAEMGLIGMDHVGLTVPDINQAIEWFEDVMGAAAPLTFGPFSDPVGTFMHDLLDVDPRAVISQITMLRIGHSANIELFQYSAPDQRHDFPRNSDWSGHHIAFYVTDIDDAVEYMASRGVQKFLGPLPVTDGPAAGQSINYFRTPFGTYIELISYPNGMAYERARHANALWSPKENGLRPEQTKVPGLLGVDHVGITVPNVVDAARWFTDVLGFGNPLTFGPFSDPTGSFIHDLLDVDPRAVVEQIRMVGPERGANVELFQYTAPDQDRTFRRNSDYGAKHITYYVKDIDKAVAYLQSRGVEKLLGPLPVTDGPAAGQSINYFKTPFGTFIELISYPHGMAYEQTADVLLWNPRDNRN